MQTTRKRDCPATITIREFEVFPEYGYTVEEVVQISDYALWKFKLTNLKKFKKCTSKKATCESRSSVSCLSSILALCGVQSDMAQCPHI